MGERIEREGEKEQRRSDSSMSISFRNEDHVWRTRMLCRDSKTDPAGEQCPLEEFGMDDLTISGVEAPSVCEVESAFRLGLLLVSPGRPVGTPPPPPSHLPLPPDVLPVGVPVLSRSSITRSIGILPFRQLM